MKIRQNGKHVPLGFVVDIFVLGEWVPAERADELGTSDADILYNGIGEGYTLFTTEKEAEKYIKRSRKIRNEGNQGMRYRTVPVRGFIQKRKGR